MNEAALTASSHKNRALNETRIRVRYAETDQMGIVYHGNYFPWMEMGRVELCRANGIRLIMSDGRMEPLSVGGDSAEVLTRMKQPFLVLPNSVSQLRIHLATQRNADISVVGSKAQVLVLGELSITRDKPAR